MQFSYTVRDISSVLPTKQFQEISKDYLEMSMKSQELKEKKFRVYGTILSMTGDMID